MNPTFRAYRLHAPPEGSTTPEGRFETLGVDDLSAGDVLIRVAYAGLNYKDALAGAGRGRIVRQYPRIGGIDLSGSIVEPGATGLAPGTPVVVHGFGVGVEHDGGYAQYARVPADWVMALPEGIDVFAAAALGVAGYTAALALHTMEHNGLVPEAGPVLVTGASGGSGSIAVDMLAGRGYAVEAWSGKPDAVAALQALGARSVGPAPAAPASGPLESARWAGAIDTVGGAVLARVLAQMQPEGVVGSFGNAGGLDLDTTVLPFILRGVKLLGINANSPMPLRRIVWGKLAGPYRARHLAELTRVIGLDDLPAALDDMLARRSRGRLLLEMP